MAEHPAIAAGFTVGGFAIFLGYSQLEEGQQTILEKDMPVRIERFDGEADIVVVGVDDDGNDILNDDGTPKFAERVFPEELEAAELDDTSEEAVAEEAPAPEPEKPKGRARAKAAPKAAEEPAAETPAAEAKPKGRAAKAKPAAKAEEAPATEELAAEEPAAEAKPARTRKAKPAEAPAEEKAKADTKIKATPVVEITDMASVREILAEQDALAAAKSLVDRAEQTDFTLGGVLRHIHETGAFKSIGYDGKRGFDDYVSTTLGIEPRKARYLMQIYTAFAMVGADETKLQSIGWSKAKELARINPAELKRDINKLLKDANELTRTDLIAKIKKTYKVVSRGNGETVSLTKFSFSLAEEEAQTVTEGLQAAMQLVGEQDLNKAFAYIVGDWRNTGTGSDLSLEDTLELMLAKFGLKKIEYTTAENEAFVFEADEPAEAEAAA